ncbi:serine--tRNA ligase [Candidatus Parcubacteria bacterium]|nr:serine--tRNA ligase [Candidatus Parcubacteria bacterium]
MLDIKYIQKNKKKIKEAAKNKNIDIDIDLLLKINNEKRGAQTKLDELRAKRNELAKSAKGGRPTDKQIKKGKKIKEETAALEAKLKNIKINFNDLIIQVPNVISDDTPIGKDESENKVIRKFGEPTEFDFKPKDHMELGMIHGIIDTEKSANISGSRFNYLFGEAVLLQFALIQFIMAALTDRKIIKQLADKVGNPFDKPFTPVLLPVMVKSEVMKKMDRFDPLGDRYYLEQDEVLLIGSAEHTLGPIHMNEIIKEKDLPIRYIGYSTAFRREAGSYGKDMAGILRRHQFDKAEMETFVQAEYGQLEQNLIVAIQEYLLQRLNIPYQVVAVCSGDMGKPDFRQIDIECWMPGQNKYRETHTSDYMTDFQSRRLNIKYKTKTGDKKFVHMNDATAFAMGRILIAIIENYQQKDGSIIIPEVLRKYMPGNIGKIVKK